MRESGPDVMQVVDQSMTCVMWIIGKVRNGWYGWPGPSIVRSMEIMQSINSFVKGVTKIY